MPRLSEILDAVPAEDIEVGGLCSDSREVRPGDLFAALPGLRNDGGAFVAEALAKGAVAVLASEDARVDAGAATLVTDPLPRRLFSRMAARFFGRQPEVIAAVTGTNGKTSVVNFLRQIWAAQRLPAASLGTLGVVAPGRVEKGSLTTPDPVTLHRILAELAEGGVTHTALEASSHGLAQYRLDGVRISAAAFTNLTRDHLDYHGDMKSYWRAKTRLFTEVMGPQGVAVINGDAPEATELAGLCRERGQRVITFGVQGKTIRIAGVVPTPGGQDLELVVNGQSRRLNLPLAGTFQASNAVCALGLALATGADADSAVAALAYLEGAPGRLQKVAGRTDGATVFVDYAHTPDALETVLKALRPHARGRLCLVFGCGGDRDPGKRPMMGRIAATLADRAIVTDDNPRGEDPAAIRAQILAACPDAEEIGDRRSAIRAAVAGLRADDILVVAGKGHESGQIVKDRVLPFDDAREARAALEERP